MKKKFLMLAALVLSASAYSQFYVSLSGGYGFESNKKVLGQDVNAGVRTDLEGSYGAGIQTQLRAGYFFTNTIGAELALGYLHGENTDTQKVTNTPGIPTMSTYARGRAFGASLSAVVNITENIYVRAGGVTKVGGRTESYTQVSHTLPVALFNPTVTDPTVQAELNAAFQTNFHGKIPFGFIGAVGYKHKLTDKISIFGEVEYLNIAVPRKKSKLDSFSATFAGQNITRDQLVGGVNNLLASPIVPEATKSAVGRLLPLVQDEYDWTNSNPPDAPYSSWGFHVGVTYHFGK
ncbi:MAG: outer membrane beta-barrel protein [Capnocytophaga sp.]|nr:outer membrane beta-barrel protein [Capnocytophaga sp.]